MSTVQSTWRWARVIALAVAMLVIVMATSSRAQADTLTPVLTVSLAGDGNGTVTSDDSRIDCTSGQCSTTYAAPGGIVTLTATPSGGSGFEGFSGCTATPSPNSCTVTMTGDQTVQATFALPPAASVSSPVDGTYYAPSGVPTAVFACQPDPSASPQSCSATVDPGTSASAPINNGDPMPAQIGAHTLTATATDTDGQSGTGSATYHVADPPTAGFTAPADAQPFAVGQQEVLGFSCTDGTGGPGISGCTDSAGDSGSADTGSGSTGSTTLDTSAPGTYTISLTPASSDKLPASTYTYTYTVAGAPVVSVGTPAAGDPDYATGSVPSASFSCTAGASGSAPSCSALSGDGSSLNNGDPLPSTPGAHTLTVTATADGQTTTVTRSYTVSAPPGASIQVPGPGVPTYASNSVPTAAFTCTPDPNSSLKPGVDGCSASIDGGPPVATGTQLPSAAGLHQVVVTAVDADGQSFTADASYTVAGAPVVSVTTPAAGDPNYAETSVPSLNFSCAAGASGSAPSCSAVSGDGSALRQGDPLPSTPGAHTVTVTATADGQTTPVTRSYTVSAPPTLAVAEPTATTYSPAAVPASDFTCSPGQGTARLDCSASVDGGPSATSGAQLPSTPGSHTIVITAADQDGQSVSDTISYVVAAASPPTPATQASSSGSPKFVFIAPPAIDARRPVQGAVYTLGEKVTVVYSCSDAAGPGLKSCSGTVGSGRQLDTSRLGQHTFTVTGADTGGESSSEAITYTVVPTTNRFGLRRPRAGRHGALRLALRLPGPGAIRVIATAAGTRRHRVLYASRRLSAHGAGPLHVSIAPTAAGRRLVRGAQRTVSLAVTYTPLGGRPRTVHVRGIRP